MLLLFLGTIDFGRFLYYQTALNSAARVGAEAAGNECGNRFLCARFNAGTINDQIMQSTECEAINDAGLSSLQPSLSCTAGISTDTLTDPCSSTCTPCAKDICIIRHTTCSTSGCDPCATSAGSVSTVTSGQCVQIIIGYNFTPIAPFVRQFFPTKQCWSGDTTTHTLCASFYGKVY
jgi:hypothetical protein